MKPHFIASMVLFAVVAESNIAGDELPPGAVARLGSASFETGHSFSGVTFSPDSKSIFTFDNRWDIRVWDTASGRELRRFRISPPVSMRFTRDGSQVAAVNRDGTVRIIETTTGKEIAALAPEKPGQTTVAWMPDGKRLAVSGEDGIVRIWEPAASEPPRQWKASDDRIIVLGVLTDGKQIVTRDRKGRACVWEVATAKELQTLQAPEPPATNWNRGEVSNDGKWLAHTFAGSDGVVLWELATGKIARVLKPASSKTRSSAHSLAFAPDDRYLATGSTDGKVRLWDVVTGAARQTFDVGRQVMALAFSPDGKTLAVCAGSLRLFDVATGKERLTSTGHGGAVKAVTFLGDDKRLVSSGGNKLIVWNVQTAQPELEIAAPKEGAHPLVASPDGKSVTYFSGGPVYRWQPGETPKEILQGFRKGTGATYHYLSADGKHYVTTAAGEITVAVVATRRIIFRLKERLFQPTVSPCGRFLAGGRTKENDYSLCVWDMATSAERQMVPDLLRDARPFNALTFSRDGRLLAAHDNFGTIFLFEVATGAVRQHFELPERAGIGALAFSADDRWLATGTSAGKVLLFDVVGAKLGRIGDGHRGAIENVAFSPTGQRLASASADGTILIWDVEKLAPIRAAIPKPALPQLALWWKALASPNGDLAHEAIAGLTAARDDAVAAIADQLSGRFVKVGQAQIEQWVRDLNAEKFADRERATRGLSGAGAKAEEALRVALENKPGPESRRRIEALLKTLGDATATERRQRLRAIEVLEHIGTPAARKALEAIADAVDDKELLNEVRVSLERMQKAVP